MHLNLGSELVEIEMFASDLVLRKMPSVAFSEGMLEQNREDYNHSCHLCFCRVMMLVSLRH